MLKNPFLFFVLLSPDFLSAQEQQPEDTCWMVFPNAIVVHDYDGRLYLSSNCLTDTFQLTIFNRWGERLYSQDSLGPYNSVDWNISDIKSDVYVWQLKISFKSNPGQVKKMVGHITLIR